MSTAIVFKATPLRTLVIALALTMGLITGASSQIISSMPDNPGSGLLPRTAAFAALSDVDVGAAPVTISGFGTYGHISTAGNLKWVIWSAAQSAGESPLFSTGPIGAAGGGTDFWNDSPTISYILNANSTYIMGVVADQEFTYRYDIPGVDVTAGGLTLPNSHNGNSDGTFDNPTLQTNGGGAMVSFRAFGPSASASVPEPGVIALGVGVATAGLLMMRRMGKGARREARGVRPNDPNE